MELEFQSQPFRYFRQILHKNQRQEAVMETVVPDSFPDVDRVLMSSGTPMVRSKECSGGIAAISGGVRVTVMYASEEPVTPPQSLELYLPFSLKWEQSDLPGNSVLQAEVTICSIDTRMVNSRKLIVRVNLLCCMTAYAPEEAMVSTLPSPPEGMEIKEDEYTFMLPLEASECTFPVHDRILLPKTAPYGDCVYAFTPQWSLTEHRITGNKAVFKGQLNLKVLYRTADGALQSHECGLPFSQFCTLEELHDEDDARFSLYLSRCEWEPCHSEDGDELAVSLEFTAQCTVFGNRSMQLLQDAYCLSGDLELQWKELAIQSQLDSRVLQKSANSLWEGEAECVEFLQTWVGEVSVTGLNGARDCSVPLITRVLLRDGDGKLHGETIETAVEHSVMAAEEAVVQGSAELLAASASATMTGVELHVEAALRLETYAEQEQAMLCGGTWDEACDSDEERPVILRRVREGESLWDIAKAHRTTVARLCGANQLEDDAVSAETMLIIPI